MKYFIILAILVVVVLGGVFIFKIKSKMATDSAETKKELKNDESKIVEPITKDPKAISTNPDLNLKNEVSEEIKEIKLAVEEVNKKLPAVEAVKTDPASLSKEVLTTSDFNQMSVEKLNTFLSKDAKEKDKLEALNALGEKKLEAKGSLDVVLTIMKTGTNLERAYAARAIGNIDKEDKRSLEQLITALKSDKDDNVRKEAAISIGEFSTAKTQVKELEAILLTETNEHVKAKLQLVLFNLRQKE